MDTQQVAWEPVDLAIQLVRIPSVTDSPNHDVTASLAGLLHQLDFDVRIVDYTDSHGRAKQYLEARRGPTIASAGQPIAYFCHTDVVSVAGWNAPAGGAFDGKIQNDRLWSRGACDMKGSVASMLAALARVKPNEQIAPVYFFMTGDEECGMVGADLLAKDSVWFAECVQSEALGIIGEPTELQTVNTHKGGCHIEVVAAGVAAHSSTHDGDNANWKLIPFLTALNGINQRCENDSQLQNRLFDPPTLSMNIVLDNRPAMPNITVGQARCSIFFRPMPEVDWQGIAEEITHVANGLGLETNPLRPLPPVFTPPNSASIQRFQKAVGSSGPKAVSYATDGCCFTRLKDIVVFGPGSIEQAHRPDEWIELDQLQRGADAFEHIIRQFSTSVAN